VKKKTKIWLSPVLYSISGEMMVPPCRSVLPAEEKNETIKRQAVLMKA